MGVHHRWLFSLYVMPSYMPAINGQDLKIFLSISVNLCIYRASIEYDIKLYNVWKSAINPIKARTMSE